MDSSTTIQASQPLLSDHARSGESKSPGASIGTYCAVPARGAALPSNLQKRAGRSLVRPKSSPASVMSSRTQLQVMQRRQQSTVELTLQRTPMHQVALEPAAAAIAAPEGRGGSWREPTPVRRNNVQPSMRPASAAVVSQNRLRSGVRPASAAVGSQNRLRSGVRPASAAVGSQRSRPPSASGQRRPSSSSMRPRTALGIRQKPSLVLVDLEEDDSEEQAPAIIRDTPPVHRTDQPEYFDFWLGKPLLKRDYGIQVHKRKAWKRPQSDYGNRLGRRRGSGDDDSSGRKGGVGDGLETVMEQDNDGMGLGHGGGDGGGGGGAGGGGEKDGGAGDEKTNGNGSVDGDGNLDAQSKLKSKKHKKKSSGKKDKKISKKKLILKASDSAEADNDDYFNSDNLAAVSWLGDGSSSKTTRFELPMDLTSLSEMTPLQYLRKHCVLSNRHMTCYSKIFSKCDADRDLRLTVEEVKTGLICAHHSCITLDQVIFVLELARVPKDFKFDAKLFAALCCLTERTLSLYSHIPSRRKDLIETADFEALDWKLRDCHVNASLYTLFTQL